MTIPAPPSGESFSTKEHPNALVAMKVLRVDPNHPDTFNRNGGNPVSATFLDVWVLADAFDVGSYVSDVPNTSMLGRQLAGSVGQTFYGRIVSRKVGNGTSYVLGEPFPQDAPVIEAHKAQLAAEYAAPRQQGNVRQFDYSQPATFGQRNASPQPAYTPPQGQPQGQPAYVPPAQPQPSQQPTQGYPPQGYPQQGQPQGQPPQPQDPWAGNNPPPPFSGEPPF